MIKINSIAFNDETPKLLKDTKYGSNWPVVYIINNEKEAYIGETTDARVRSSQHLTNESRKKLNKINIISDDTFNKSSVLDLESFLIKYMAADNNFTLQNGNSGLQNHDYYQREMYQKQFSGIWKKLKLKGLVKNELQMIENSDLFKYSPYKALTNDQFMIVHDILEILGTDVTEGGKSVFLVTGGAGTGKTILGVYMMKLLSDQKTYADDENELLTFNHQLKVAFVIPMDNLRKTIRKVFREIKGLNANVVKSPNEIARDEEDYDLIIVDEAHRLRRRINIAQYEQFDKNNNKYNLGKEGTELDWIMLKSKHQILFYDEHQSIKPTDVRKEEFNKLLYSEKYHHYSLDTQLRCLLGGDEYIRYVKEIFSLTAPLKKLEFDKYDLKLFDHIDDMIVAIKQKDKEIGLCRNIAGYAWKWETKEKGSKRKQDYDIEIEGQHFIWNTTATDWINSKNSINEIGSIHTTQGFDLNYTGIIIGEDLRYDLDKGCLFADRKKYSDVKGKNTTTDAELLQYIFNIYSTMCTRGMKGTYLYACDPGLRTYLKRYIDEWKS